MRVFLELRSEDVLTASAASPETREKALNEQLLRVRRTLVKRMYWEAVEGDDFDALVNEMADRLPPEDLLGFAKNVRHGLRLMSPASQIAIGGFVDEDSLIIRIRLMANNDAVIVKLALDVGNELLANLPDYSLTSLRLWRDRVHDDLLSGAQETISRVGFLRAMRLHKELSIPFCIAVGFLIIGYIVANNAYAASRADPTQTVLFLGDGLWVWYTRLVGPMLMAAVTTSAGILVWMKQTGSRSVDWTIKSAAQRGGR